MMRGRIKKYFEDNQYGYIETLESSTEDFKFQLENCCGDWIPKRGDICEFEGRTSASGKKYAVRIRQAAGTTPATPAGNAAVPARRPPPAETDNSYPNPNPNPYHFANINLKLAIADAPVWHDGSAAGRTGKLRISLRTLTPLLVGWTQYELSEATNEIHNCQIGKIDKISLNGVDQSKKVLEPFRLVDGKVVVAGKSLNGMIRHSLSALLSAPMERVAERVYSYRPMLKPIAEENDRLHALPAIIDGWDENGALNVRVLPTLQCVYFANANIEARCKALKDEGRLGTDVSGDDAEAFVDDHHKQYFHSCPGKCMDNYHIFCYVGGIDACGELHRRFHTNPRKRLHRFVAVPTGCVNGATPKQIDPVCITHYADSLRQLSDKATGHLMPGHPLLREKNGVSVNPETVTGALAKQIERWESKSDKLKNQLIYVEVERKPDGEFGPIRSFGHNFQYRTRYVDSVRIQDGAVRGILTPLPREATFDGRSPPARLSGARLFCGYVSRREPTKAWHEQGSDNIGSGTHLRLKGRIGCGFAVEQIDPKRPTEQDRFLPGTGNGQFLIPLKPLGMPRPSAVEHYLRQPSPAEISAKRHDGAGLLTYGDLPKVPGGAADETGELAGRKFYRHQTEAARDPACYTDIEHVGSNQAALGRYISKANTVFRFTLDFQDLRDWELGALLVTVFPSRCLPALVAQLAAHDSAFAALKAKLDALNRQADEQRPALAHKLGHGRPLGLGSVLLDLDQAELLDVDAGGMPRLDKQDGLDGGLPDPGSVVGKTLANGLAAFADKLLETKQSAGLARHLERWAAVHRYAGQGRAAYPLAKTKENHQDVMRIYAHHTNIRKDHMRDRRKPAPDPKVGHRDGRALDEPNLNDLIPNPKDKQHGN